MTNKVSREVANRPLKTLGLANFSRITRVSQSRFIRSCLGVLMIFRPKAKGLEVPIHSFICFINDVFPSLDTEATDKFPRKR